VETEPGAGDEGRGVGESIAAIHPFAEPVVQFRGGHHAPRRARHHLFEEVVADGIRAEPLREQPVAAKRRVRAGAEARKRLEVAVEPVVAAEVQHLAPDPRQVAEVHRLRVAAHVLDERFDERVARIEPRADFGGRVPLPRLHDPGDTGERPLLRRLNRACRRRHVDAVRPPALVEEVAREKLGTEAVDLFQLLVPERGQPPEARAGRVHLRRAHVGPPRALRDDRAFAVDAIADAEGRLVRLLPRRLQRDHPRAALQDRLDAARAHLLADPPPARTVVVDRLPVERPAFARQVGHQPPRARALIGEERADRLAARAHFVQHELPDLERAVGDERRVVARPREAVDLRRPFGVGRIRERVGKGAVVVGHPERRRVSRADGRRGEQGGEDQQSFHGA